jgi:hypothetical protein
VTLQRYAGNCGKTTKSGGVQRDVETPGGQIDQKTATDGDAYQASHMQERNTEIDTHLFARCSKLNWRGLTTIR